MANGGDVGDERGGEGWRRMLVVCVCAAAGCVDQGPNILNQCRQNLLHLTGLEGQARVYMLKCRQNLLHLRCRQP
jgi:hypothetical protein